MERSKKSNLNPELKIGDRIVLYHMDSESSVSPGDEGTVTNIVQDPFESADAKIISVKWDNGSTLSLVSVCDVWKKVESEINEDAQKQADFVIQNEEIFDSFDWRFLRQFLKMIQSSGIVNMFGAAPLLYAGREHIDRYYGEGREDEQEFQEVLDNADEAKNKMIDGTIKFMEKNNNPINVDSVNSKIRRLSQKILEIYMIFY
jgi:hypothetical protein